jgi:hypothetical protein
VRKVPAAMLASLLFTLLFTATAFATPPQSDCSALNSAKGEGKFTGKISSAPDGSSMNVTYGDQTVLVHYTSSVTVCQGGQPASLSALTQGASVSVFGPMRRNGSNMEIDAARIFVAGRPQTAQTSPVPAQPKAQQAPPAQPSQAPAQPYAPQAQPSVPQAQPYAPQAQPYAQQAQPRATNSHPIPNSVILGGGTHAATMQRLHVVRKYALPDLRTNSQVTLGVARLDFRPMLDNPKAPFNVAQRLRAIPQHVQVQEETSEITEVDQGLVIHHVVSYRILPGKCNDPDARAQLSRAGIACFTRASVGERVAEFSKPGAPHYVAAPEKRQAAIAAFQRNNPLADADASKGIAELRKSLANPSQRAAITAQIGQAETARLGSLTDDQLKEEMINSAAQRIEETMFVPKVESANYAHPQHALANATNTGEMTAVQQLLREGVPEHGASPSNFPKLLKVVPATTLHHSAGSAAPGGDKPADLEMGPYIFLTGFTIGHDYEWSWGISVTINWCVVGCSSTYSIDLHAGFNYGFGLRFPIHTQFKYHTVVHGNNSAEADLTATFEPIEGTVNDFFSAGLSSDQMYDGKELVAQVGANAGFDYNLPVVGSGGQGFNVGVDFTDLLPAPYTHGKFLPPAPGAHGIDSPYVFNTIDLLGDLFNFGAVGGAVYPAVNVNLHSNKLEFTLNDEILRRQTRLTKTGQTVSLGLSQIANGSESHFSIGNPVYNLGFTLTPGLAPTVFVDVAVWSNTWTWPVWFPQLAVDLPPNGIDFGCHAGTTCVMDFTEVYDASTGQVRDVSKEADVADRTLTGGGCQLVGTRTSGQPGKYLCPVKGMLGLCQAMLKNDAVASCGALVPNVVDEILKRGHCTSSDGAYVCPGDMMGLCDVYLKNQEILSCKQK